MLHGDNKATSRLARHGRGGRVVALCCAGAGLAQEGRTNAAPVGGDPPGRQPSGAETNLAARTDSPRWNWHVQNTDIVQGDPGFPARYSGPNSLHSGGEARETVSLDLYAGLRLWPGAEAHIDGLMWQGFGLSRTFGVEGFPSGEAFKVGTQVPNVNLARYFVRQTIGFGGETEAVEDDELHVGSQQDLSRLTITLGRMSAKDIFDNNRYANDPRTQFMNWALMANEAWDYPADPLGYITGIAFELNQREWTARYGFFQMPARANGAGIDQHLLEAWGMVSEFERRFAFRGHPGAVRVLGYLNRAHMGNYCATVDDPSLDMDITLTRAYRYKHGFGLNFEQELFRNVGVFSRLGWSDGQTEAWVFSDVDHTATAGVSLQGEMWKRPGDTFGFGAAANGLSSVHQRFFEAGGTGILAGDGALNYGWEKILETYYDFDLWKSMHLTADYQFIANPAFNRDRGPVSVFGGRVHWEF